MARGAFQGCDAQGRIGLACPAGRSGPWSRRTGAPEASAIGRDWNPEPAHGLLTRLSDTGRDSAGQPPVGKRRRRKQRGLYGARWTPRNGAPTTHNPEVEGSNPSPATKLTRDFAPHLLLRVGGVARLAAELAASLPGEPMEVVSVPSRMSRATVAARGVPEVDGAGDQRVWPACEGYDASAVP
jgi:hypothetical protein